MENRLTDLEIKFTQQDDLLLELNSIVAEQQKVIDVLIREIRSLKSSQANSEASQFVPENEIPPHY